MLVLSMKNIVFEMKFYINLLLGLVWSLRPCDLEVKLLQDSRHVYESLEKESGDFAGWINNGGMFISRSKVKTATL